MIEKIRAQLINESGDAIPIKDFNISIESLLETTTAEQFTEICTRNNKLTDDEIRRDEKFRFCLNLREYLIDLEDLT